MPRRTQPSAHPEWPVRDKAADDTTDADSGAVEGSAPGVPTARRSPATRRSSVAPRPRRGSGDDELNSSADEQLAADEDESAAVEADAAAALDAEAVVDDALLPGERVDSRDEAPTQRAAQAPTRTRVSRALTDREREMLRFEHFWWRHAGSKEQAIRETFDLSATHYYRLLNALLDVPAAAEFDAVVVGRLRRLRASRTWRRSGR